MKKISMFGAAGIMAMSLLIGMAGCTATADAKAKSHRCSVVKGCRVTGTHHSKKHHTKKKYKTSHHSSGHHSSSHHSGHHN